LRSVASARTDNGLHELFGTPLLMMKKLLAPANCN
jgi:hypothetical protein